MTQRAGFSSEVVWSASELDVDPHGVADKAKRVRRMFAAIAPRYDLNNRIHSFGRDQAWRRRAVLLCRPLATDRVLDAACGTGDLAEAFAAAGAATVCGVDFTPEMLEIARRKAGSRRRTGTAQPTYLEADVMNLPFADESFDIVSIAFGLRNVSQPRRALEEFRRLLRPGGCVVVLEFSQPTNRLLRVLNGVYCDQIMPLTATLLSGDRSGAYRYLPRSVATFADRQELAAMMRDAGLVSITPHPMTFGVCVAYVGKKGLRD
ncbi:MAG: bifunctional demethylmenaquinone methyltransferase/2-methoxy-6-polyprenyl-1,4-benzoquinol methylase UbiE [Planctomycetota bacterium]